MFRTAITALVIALSTPTLASAQAPRDTQGERVEVAESGTVMLFWSMSDRDAAAKLVQLAKLAESGLDVVAVNTDDVTAKARVRPFVRRLGVDVRTAQDTDGALQSTWDASDGEALVLRPVRVDQVVWRGTELAELMPVEMPDVERVAR
ncbi:MAG: hypothetical protein KC912_20645 [Proteobacteria bacterium]|nr:hypothetical protein [Pseudomonadota bacterium]